MNKTCQLLIKNYDSSNKENIYLISYVRQTNCRPKKQNAQRVLKLYYILGYLHQRDKIKNGGENIILNLFFVYNPHTPTRVHVQFTKE